MGRARGPTRPPDLAHPHLPGGFRKLWDERLDRDWLPGWLQGLGYDTTLVGKFINGYPSE